MRAQVRAVTPEAFERWATQRREGIRSAAEDLAAQRQQRERQDQ